MQFMTDKEFRAALPAGLRKKVNPLLIMQINNIIGSEEETALFRDNLLSYASVLQHGKFKMGCYLRAVRYVGFKVMGCTNRDAYLKTFPDKLERFLAEGVDEKTMSCYITSYNKSKLVNLIYEQTLIPSYILNAPYFQDALNVQVSIMLDTKVSPMVRSNAANSVMLHLKPPEVKKLELEIAVDPNNVIDTYTKAMDMMVAKQLEMIAAGGDIRQIANASITTVEVIDI